MGNDKSIHTSKFSTSLDDSRIKELIDKTNLNKEDIIKMHKEFIIDCPNGKLDKKLFNKFFKQLFPNGNSKQFCEICFLAYDKDKNGYIDFYEFAYAMGIILKGNIEDKLKLAFDIYDYNDDGYIEKKEAETIVCSLFKMYGDNVPSKVVKFEVERLMSKFDSDKNGMLTEQEFVEGCLKDDELKKFFAPLFK